MIWDNNGYSITDHGALEDSICKHCQMKYPKEKLIPIRDRIKDKVFGICADCFDSFAEDAYFYDDFPTKYEIGDDSKLLRQERKIWREEVRRLKKDPFHYIPMILGEMEIRND